MTRIAIIDHGAGNLRSVQKALQAVGAEVCISRDPGSILAADKVVLPGVGAFADVMRALTRRGLLDVTLQVAGRGTPLLGICVGMQILFEMGEEHGRHPGLGLLPGRVTAFPRQKGLKIPHTGWNRIHIERDSPLLAGLPEDRYAYFNHSYYCAVADPAVVLGSTDYGLRYASVVARGSLYGVQFHPEKSQRVGLAILRNFVEECE